MNVLFKTPNKKLKLKAYHHAGEENPSTACRHPKKRYLMNGKTVIILLSVSLVLVSITFTPRTPPPRQSPPVSQPMVTFNQTYGGTDNDAAFDLVQTADGGFSLVGYTFSYGAGGGPDMWLVKTNASGNVIWNRTYGGSDWDWASSLVQTIDGGFALVGYTSSYGTVSPYGEGIHDMWLVKTDANGVMIWNQTYGGNRRDEGTDVIQTLDGGFALMGFTHCARSDLWSDDMWLVKTNANGVMIWNRTYGSTGNDQGHSVIQTLDGGFALVGSTSSFGAGANDMWLVKTDANGNVIWHQTYGVTGDDEGKAVIQTIDGGFALVGSTSSFGAGANDMWLVKTDTNGNVTWHQTFGGTGSDEALDLVQTVDGGFALAGYTQSYGQGGRDMWLVKTDANGVMIWNQTYGGLESEIGRSVIQTVDGRLALVGYTSSFGTEGIIQDMAEEFKTSNMWLVIMNINGAIQPSSIATTISSSTPTPGWGPVTLLVAVVVLVTWHRRRKRLK